MQQKSDFLKIQNSFSSYWQDLEKVRKMTTKEYQKFLEKNKKVLERSVRKKIKI